MRGGTTDTALVGRDEEIRLLGRLLAEVARGRGAALLIHGSAGVGKSALLRRAQAEATVRGLSVLTTAGVETERDFPFAAMHLLLQPFHDRVARLTKPHRQALRAVFGAADGEPDIYRIALAALELLAEAAAQRPVLILADDLQWFDSSSRDVLAFIARRTHGHPLLVVGAARDQHAQYQGIEDNDRLPLSPLAPSAAAELLDAEAPELRADVRALILDQARGNPLALRELPRATRDPLRDGADGLALTQRLEQAFAARTDTTSTPCRTLLLVLAAEPTIRLDRLLAVTGHVARTAVALDTVREAIDAGLIELADRSPRFRHPLMRSAIYSRATVGERLAVHGAVAAVFDDDLERQLAHRAAAALGPDEDLARQLVAFADAALSRGRPAAAVQALRRAAPLVRPGPRRTGILVRAAQTAGDLSDREQTRALLAQADLSTAGPVEQARLLLVSDNSAFEPDEPHRRIHDMVDAVAAAAAAGARDVAENLLWRAAARCAFQDPDEPTRRRLTAQLDDWRAEPDDALTMSVRAYAEPWRYGVELLDLLSHPGTAPDDGRTLHFLGSGAMVLGDFSHSSRLLARAAAVWREQGRLGLLARSLIGAWPRLHLGDLSRARAEADEGRALARETGETIAWLGLTATAALAAAMQGEAEQAAALLRELRADALFGHLPFATVLAQQADGLLALLDGRAEEAFATLALAFEPGQPSYHSVSRWRLVPELADAAFATGSQEQVRKLLTELPELTERLPSEMMRSARAYTHYVLADDDRAEHRFAEALAGLPDSCKLLRARLHLHHGLRLRRQRRYLDARDPLRTARDQFDRLGARPWAETARTQLRATGESSSRRLPTVIEQLSAQELQIAMLAAQGMTNREIGQRMFISHRTVGTYLYRIYPRLGISNRRQLSAALAASPSLSRSASSRRPVGDATRERKSP